jgi:hypothetical protein
MFFGIVIITVLTIVGLCLCSLIAGVVLDIIWVVKKKKKKIVRLPIKVCAIIFSVCGVLGFVLPVTYYVLNEANRSYDFNVRMESFPVLVELNRDKYIAFINERETHVIDGKTYVKANIKHCSATSENCQKEPLIAYKFSAKRAVECYALKNDKDFDMLSIDGSIWVEQSELDLLTEYYTNQVECTRAQISYKDPDNTFGYKCFDLDFDPDILNNIIHIRTDRPNYGDERDDIVASEVHKIGYFNIICESADGIYKKDVIFFITEDRLGRNLDDTYGYYFLSDDESDYILDLLKKQTDYEFSWEK